MLVEIFQVWIDGKVRGQVGVRIVLLSRLAYPEVRKSAIMIRLEWRLVDRDSRTYSLDARRHIRNLPTVGRLALPHYELCTCQQRQEGSSGPSVGNSLPDPGQCPCILVISQRLHSCSAKTGKVNVLPVSGFASVRPTATLERQVRTWEEGIAIAKCVQY